MKFVFIRAQKKGTMQNASDWFFKWYNMYRMAKCTAIF